ncbi:MAG: PTS system mannose/fructose/sorbose family transporter subunit IID [Proteobacteria bacterium]|nr:PTS system mannose/fructose/sorbose family transporter subunit IID [Pseudomonadota bacterium]MBU2567573.1 PTS system mannose/fructose/sorbose family transporter subunit IID [Elusimicrobiota bacterium]
MKTFSRFRIFFRSLFLQSAWNFERIQNIGFLYCVFPALRMIYKNKPELLHNAVKRHSGFFNTHPYMANILIGLTIALEEQVAGGDKSVSREEIEVFKSNMAGPLAAIGDAFFWATWRPFCALLVVAVVFLYGGADDVVIKVSLGVFLLVYNSVHIGVRYMGLKEGYGMKTKIVKKIATFKVQKLVDNVRIAGIVIICVIVVKYFLFDLSGAAERGFFALALAAGIFLDVKKISVTFLFYGLIIISVLYAYAGKNF